MKPAVFFPVLAGSAVAFVALGWAFPSWVFLLSIAFTKGIAVLGLILLLRAGLVSFGQGLFFAAGGYTVGMLAHLYKIHEAALLIGAAAAIGFVLSAVVGALLARYRDIFFAMLTLALSMILYGLLVRTTALGGTDGFNVKGLTFLGLAMTGAGRFTGFTIIVAFAAISAIAAWLFTRTALGRLAGGVKENEIRIEYLGASANTVVHVSYVIAGVLASVGGALSGIAVGHVDPEMAFWSASGEFVLIGVLAGSASVLTPFLSALILEFVRSYATQYAPNTWQLVLGCIIFALILFLPGGLAGIRLGRKAVPSLGDAV